MQLSQSLDIHTTAAQTIYLDAYIYIQLLTNERHYTGLCGKPIIGLIIETIFLFSSTHLRYTKDPKLSKLLVTR